MNTYLFVRTALLLYVIHKTAYCCCLICSALKVLILIETTGHLLQLSLR